MAKKKRETFESILLSFTPKYKLYRVFDDFLTLTIAACGLDPKTGLSYDEALYLETIRPYATDSLRFAFGKAFGQLVIEMTERIPTKDGSGWDVLGEFFEKHLSTPQAQKRKGQIFTPWTICYFMAASCGEHAASGKVLHILDPACGSGRIQLAASRVFGSQHLYWAIDNDRTCVKMAALNYFLSNMQGEAMCANALLPDDFRESYRISRYPLGIFRITEKEQSPLWNRMQETFSVAPKDSAELQQEFEAMRNNVSKGNGSQLSFFDFGDL